MGVRVRERDGCWWVFINHHNKRKAKKIGPGPEGARVANQLADKLRVRLAYGEDLDGPQATPLLREYAEDWMRQIHVTKKAGTAETYERHMLRVWLPAFGKYPLDKITRAMVKRVLFKLLGDGLSRDYVVTTLIPLQSCFTAAAEDELVKSNPAANHGRALGPRSGKAREVFTDSELDQLFDAAIDYSAESYVKILILCRTGMRVGEMLALQPGDIDFNRQQIWVRRTWGSRKSKLRRGCINIPKSGKWRWVDMSPQLAEVLRDYLDYLPKAQQWLFKGKLDALPLHPNGFQFIWLKLMARTGLRRRPIHSLRHTYVSMLIDRGENMLYIRDQLGHTSIKITMDTYGHMMPDAQRPGASKLDSAEPIRNPYATTEFRLIIGGHKIS
jgi:integrase